jgi:glyoxylase-like metal-dependent hydrolase (beta-lactamase superfamily II)
MGAWEELGDQVFRRRYPMFDFNVGAVVAPDGVLVVDTRASHLQGRELLEDLRRLTPLTVRWVINTHFHWDHCWGNAVFQEAEIWGHDCCRLDLIENGESRRAEVLTRAPAEMLDELRAVEIVPPDRVLFESDSIDLDGRAVNMRYLGRGHTNSDIIVDVPDASVVFAGDLIEEGSPPVFRDAYPLEWPSAVRAMLKGAARVVVPGHGDVVDRSFITSQLRELEAVADLVRKCDAGELTLEAAAAQGPFPPATMGMALRRARSLRDEGRAEAGK